MTFSDYEKALLALALWREARGEPIEGIRAVGHVILNNANGNIAALITRKNYLSSMAHVGDPQLVVYPASTDAVFQNILPIAENLYEGIDSDNTNGAMFYANVDNVPAGANNWFWANIIQRPDIHPVTVVIGHHTFFK